MTSKKKSAYRRMNLFNCLYAYTYTAFFILNIRQTSSLCRSIFSVDFMCDPYLHASTVFVLNLLIIVREYQKKFIIIILRLAHEFLYFIICTKRKIGIYVGSKCHTLFGIIYSYLAETLEMIYIFV